jgi:hypothetical protein
VGYQTLVKPTLHSTAESLAPALTDALDAAKSVKETGSAAIEALKGTAVGGKIADMWEKSTPFFDPMPDAPRK